MMDDEDLKDGLTFILENPTKEEHAFAVRGMFEMTAEKSPEAVAPGEEPGMVYHLKPIRVTVPAGATKHRRRGSSRHRSRETGQRRRLGRALQARGSTSGGSRCNSGPAGRKVGVAHWAAEPTLRS